MRSELRLHYSSPLRSCLKLRRIWSIFSSRSHLTIYLLILSKMLPFELENKYNCDLVDILIFGIICFYWKKKTKFLCGSFYLTFISRAFRAYKLVFLRDICEENPNGTHSHDRILVHPKKKCRHYNT